VLDPDVPLERLWQRDFRRLRRAARALGDEPSDEALHALRIRGKRARYAAELAAPALGKPTSRYLRESKRFQDVLGEHQDAVVAEERIRALLRRSRSAPAQVGGGRLIERQRARRTVARAGFEDAWERLERAGRKVL
jgi:CHAD domain-containing protein